MPGIDPEQDGAAHDAASFEHLHRLPAEAYLTASELTLWSSVTSGVDHAVERKMPRRNPRVIGNLVVGLTWKGLIRAVDRLNGSEIWTRDIQRYGNGIWESNSWLYVSASHTIQALDPNTGLPIWEHEHSGKSGRWIGSSPAGDKDTIIYTSGTGQLTSLNSLSGEVNWTASSIHGSGSVSWTTPVLLEDRVITGCNKSMVICNDRETGGEMWRTKLDGPTHHEALQWRNCAVVRTEKTVYAISTQDGSVYHQWHWPNNSLWSLEMRADQLFLVMRQAEIPGQPIHPQAEFVGLIGDTEVYRSTYPPHITPNLKYESGTGLLYEASRQGLGIVDPRSGHRLFAIYDFQRYGRYDLHADYTSLPTIIDDTMFLVNELGTIFALKHPQ